jgi:hypothetical protein
MSLYLSLRLPSSLSHVAVFLFFLLSSGFAAPLSAQPPLGELEILVFDDVVGPGNPDITGLVIDPWLFASQKFHTVSLSDAGILGLANNGTPYIASVGGGLDYQITLERVDGSPFSLIGFDAAEGFLDDLLAAQEGFISATRIEVEAALTSGFTVTLEFDLDGLRDGPNGVDDFEALTMTDSLQRVTSVTFTGLAGNRRDAGFALDNVVVAAVVPEPASLALVASAAAMFGVWRWRRARTK